MSLTLILWLFLVATTLFTMLKGQHLSIPIAASVNLVAAFAALAFPAQMLFIDLGLAVAFLAITMWCHRFWLGALMLVQGGQFCLHAYNIITNYELGIWYQRINNINTVVICLVLIIATFRVKALPNP